MRTRWLAPRALAILVMAATAVGCKIDSTTYLPPGDGDGGADDDGGAQIDAAVDAPDGIYVVVSPSVTTVSEGGQVTVRVSLSEAPAADRTILITGVAGVLTPTPAMLTFTPDNWNVQRTVILASAQDDDADDSPVTVLFDGQGLVADGTAQVMVTDDDSLTLIVTPPSSLGVTEGASGQVQVQLSARPSASVVVAVMTVDAAVAGASTPQLTFTTANWDTAQAITVTGVADVDTADDTTLLVLDPATEGIATVNLAINVTDDDIVAIDATPTNLGTITEAAGAGHSATFAVRLTQAPGANVTVNLAATPAAAVTVTPAQLTFTPGTFSTMQTVTVTAAADANIVDEQVSIQLAAAGLTDRYVQVAIDDADTQVLTVTPASPPAVAEGGSTTLAVRLGFQPAGNVVVDVASGDPTIANVSVAQLTFTPLDYDTVQTVQVTGVEDQDLANESTTVSFNAAAEGLTVNRTITVTDNDTQTLEVTPLSMAVSEGGTSTFTVRLGFQPAGDVTVTASTAATLDLGVSPAALSFSAATYDTAQVVTVSGLQDGDVTNEVVTVTVAAAGLASRTVSVSISDDDALDIVVTPASLAITEGASGGRPIMVSLGAMPAGNVVVSLTTNPGGVAGTSLSMLTFTPANYATPQVVTVNGADDADGADETTTLSLSAAGLADKTVAVSVTDDDIIAPMLSPNPAAMTEGVPGQANVRLSVDPGRTVTVDVTTGALDFSVSPVAFTFSSANWNVNQTVRLDAVLDDEADAEVETAQFVIAGEGSATLTVNVADQTVLLGFPPPHGGASTLVGLPLHAFRDGTLPACWVLEKVAVDVSAAPLANSQIAVALYADGTAKPSSLIWQSLAMGIGQGPGLRVIDVPDQTLIYPTATTTWLAVEASGSVALKTQAAAAPHCQRVHSFGNQMPNPFDSDGTVIIGGDAGVPDASSGDGGTTSLTCNQQAPFAVWLIGHTSNTCVDPV